ncbi:hypothetical protein M885DRAFT_216067, partial [Pelagophyceae sp. CCMP2097]
ELGQPRAACGAARATVARRGRPCDCPQKDYQKVREAPSRLAAAPTRPTPTGPQAATLGEGATPERIRATASLHVASIISVPLFKGSQAHQAAAATQDAEAPLPGALQPRAVASSGGAGTTLESDIPEPRRLVKTRRHDARAVGRERTAIEKLSMCPSSVVCSAAFSASQSRAFPSMVAVTTRLPSKGKRAAPDPVSVPL